MQELVAMIWQDKKDVLLALLAGTISGLTAVALFAQSGLLISKAALMPPFYIILILTAFLKLFGVTKSASKYAERYISHRVTFKFISIVRMNFFKKLLPQAHVLNNYKSGDLLTRITGDVEQLQNFFLRVLYPPFIAFFVFIVVILFSLFFSPWISLLLLIGIVLTSIVVPYILFRRRPYSTSTLEKKELTILATEYFYGYRDLILHHQNESKAEELSALYKAYGNSRRKELDQEQTSYLWNQLIALFTSFSVVFVGAYLTAVGQLDGLYLALIVLISLTVFESAVPLALVPIFARHTKNAVDRLEEITSKNESDGTLHLKGVIQNIQLHDVSYWYPSAARPALEQLSLNIQAGEKIAIIGPSGCGKTTLLQLLMKEIKRTSGEIYVNTTDINAISSQSMYAHMSTMLQHNHFFSGTIKSNLLMANDEASDEAIQKVLQKAQLNKNLEDPVFEKGGNLSGGEKQRLAFARLLLKDSDLWIVDEPFTSLDVQTEKILFNTLHEEAANKTVVMVTHSLADLDRFDRICVMLRGQIVECGSHQQLLAKKGLYCEMLNQ
ncbi:thiol reductant ABC exporter subunit CydC [Solibacillus merdavium]|uniref:Thiol reductant ABC exporter subunit CydC n=1 Tax=Solibacillus merdavium TaxID=2762218 RepID=A0ABR8XM57_9BACL|nr:thiol reductant ABC exporter subunit CydC [Solibacillus merdavium]MBD8033016.1 thiol reductant ABC exporter subunit CydC [Solibacillus merdavium]